MWHLQGDGSRPVWLTESWGQGWNGRRGEARPVLDPIRDSAFILIVWETCQQSLSNKRQEQPSVLKGSLELKSRGPAAGVGVSEGRGAETTAIIQASDGGMCDLVATEGRLEIGSEKT